jgi:hypothetical protein
MPSILQRGHKKICRKRLLNARRLFERMAGEEVIMAGAVVVLVLGIAAYIATRKGAAPGGIAKMELKAVRPDKAPCPECFPAEAAKLGVTEKDPGHKIYDAIMHRLDGKNFVIAEVSRGAVFPVYSLFCEHAMEGTFHIPMLGVITPLDLPGMLASMGPKSGVWVTSAKVTDPKVDEKYVVIKPDALFEITSFITTARAKAGQAKLVYMGDFLDEVYGQAEKQQLHQLLSRIRGMVKQSGDLLLIFTKRDLYKPEDYALIEEFADAKITFDGTPPKVTLIDMQENKTELISTADETGFFG